MFKHKADKTKRSFFFKRILLLLLIALLSWTLLTGIIYSLVAKPVFIEMKRKDLTIPAEWLADTCRQNLYGDQIVLRNPLRWMIAVSYDFYGFWIYVISANGYVQSTPLPANITADIRDDIQKDILTLYKHSMQNPQEELNKDELLLAKDHRMLYISAPVTDKQGKLAGTVIIAQPLALISLSFANLTMALISSSLLAGLLLLLPGIFAIKRLLRPLQQMRASAQAITLGDFSQHVSGVGEHEMADLGEAINVMAAKIKDSLSRLTLERNQLQQILDGIAEGLIAVDSLGTVTQFNDVIFQLFQKDPHRFKAQDIVDYYDLVSRFTTCMEQRQPIQEVLHLNQRRLSYLMSPLIDSSDRVWGAVGLFRDVSEEERLEQTRRDYVANVSHELRTPITAIRALLEPLMDGLIQSEDDRQQYYQMMEKESLRLSHLIDDMLKLSRLQSGNEEITLHALDLKGSLLSIQDSLALRAESKDLRFSLRVPEDDVTVVWGNFDRIEQILMILVDNAIKFSEIGSSLEIVLEDGRERAYISVIDHGRGIAPQDLPHVFDRFYQAEKSHTGKGTGLGLSIANEICKQTGMTLSVSSRPDEGATFTLGVLHPDSYHAKEIRYKEIRSEDVKILDQNEASANRPGSSQETEQDG